MSGAATMYQNISSGLSAEDRVWLEQRLELHQRAVEAQLQTQYDKLLVAVEATARLPRKGSSSMGELVEHHEGKGQPWDIDIFNDPQIVLTPGITDSPEEARTESRKENGAVESSQYQEVKQTTTGTPGQQEASSQPVSTGLHHLTLDEGEHLIPPESMRGRLISFLDDYMTTFTNFCVLANTIVMFVQLQWLGHLADTSLGLPTQGKWTNAEEVLTGLEYTFTVIFVVDLSIQLFAFRMKYFVSTFNIIDSMIVVITSVEVFVLTPLAASVGNVAVVRLLRLAKLARAFKAARTFKSFEGLRVLVATMCFSIGSIFWSLVILFVFQIMGSIFMCQSLHDFVVDPSADPAMRAWVNDKYGDGFKSFWTIFELTFSGCWPNYARNIIEKVSAWYALFYFFYVYMVVFVATRIVAALFMKETLAQYSNDAEMMVKERSRKCAWIKQTLYDLFDEADANRDGFLTTDELHSFLRHPKVQLWLKELGVDAGDQTVFIELLKEHDEQVVNRDEFVYGITRLRGEARAQDVVLLFNYVKRMQSHVKVLSHSIQRLVRQHRPVLTAFEHV